VRRGRKPIVTEALGVLVVIFVVPLTLIHSGACQGGTSSLYLDTVTWVEADKAFKSYDVVLITLGASTKEHGPHLPLDTDFLMAEYFKKRVAEQAPLVVLPTLQYGYYPAFLEYPGSISLEADTFMRVVIDICRSMNGYGFRKFYVLNTGISTLRPLRAAADTLRTRGIILRYLNLAEVEENLPAGLLKEEGGTHADEEETSIMLYIAPEKVDMSKAVRDFDARPDRRGLTRDPNGRGSYSPTGIWGDPTLATREKGKVIVEIITKEIASQVRDLIDLKLD
jgi:creatinine amidohydrolase